ncbi:MAG: DUF3084 domain-containing protein [Armatimonadota bacterium]|nr:DUF3084 domain-containing protein [Armatimonadota bacterium]
MLTFLIVTIVVMSSFIAYLGDYLGRRLGKRRLTLFGMRPKHTAILITVVTGMLIASATLGAMMVVSRDVRRALLQYHQIQDDLQQAQRDRDDAHLQVSQFRTEADRDGIELKDLQQQEQTAKRQETDVERKLTDAQQKLKEGTQALDEVRARKNLLEQSNGSLRTANGELVEDRQQKRREIEDLSQKEQEYIQDVNRLQRDVSIKAKARDEAQAQVQMLASRTTELQSRNDRLRGNNTHLAASNSDLLSSNDTLRRQHTQLKEQNEDLLAKNRTLEDTNNHLIAENDRIGILNSALAVGANYTGAKYRNIIRNKVMFEPDQLIAQGVVDCDHPAADIRQAVHDLVAKAQINAQEAGAIDSDGDGMVLRLLDPDTDLSHDEVMQKITNRLIGLHGQVVVRIQARGRFAVGDEVIAAIEDVPNRKVYQRGQTIAIAELNGQDSEKSIRNEVAAFLATKVRPTALDAGLLPDSNNQISTDILDKILDLSHEVHEKGRPVQVTAIAADDTWCYEPLDLTFKVE